ncbi:MAG: MFS transporter, partial [Chthoniobacterales bacterium]
MSFFKSKPGPVVAKEDRVPNVQKIAYGLGGVVNPFIDFVQGAMLLFFNQGLGINPGLVTTFGALFRGWDSASDPIVGNFSDNLRTKWGRRRPLIIIGAVLFGLTIP